MTIINHDSWQFSEKGLKDAQRHREKIDEHIRKNVRNVISEESIITKKHGKKISIPVRGLKDYKFIYGQGDGIAGGVGQGKGKAGDIIGQKEKGHGNNAGDQEGEDYMETEVDIDYLINIMFEDLGLPYIEEKTKKETLVPVGWKFETISKVGIQPRMHKNRTMKEAIKRTAGYVNEIMNEAGCSEGDAYKALAQAYGDIENAIKIIKEDCLDASIDTSTFFIEDDDLRYKQLEEDIEYHSNAVVIAMMDTSGSMTTDKKYMARSMLFWMVQFLKKTYNNVQIRFVTHTTDAKVVDEETFFRKGESGGTKCHTAFDLASYMIDTEYPLDTWNVYVMYLSDGEDWDYDKTISSIKDMLTRKINMLGYCEITPEDDDEEEPQPTAGYSNTLLDKIKKEFNFRIKSDSGTNFYKNDELRFLAGVIKNKSQIYPMLKHLLFEKKG
jgi:sporulation protein YhbH